MEVPQAPKKLPYVPTEEEIRRYYEAVWKAKNIQDMMIIKTLLYTGVRVSELVGIRLTDVDLQHCQIRINQGKGKKDRVVPFPPAFKETLALHIQHAKQNGGTYLFESNWKKKYTDRGIRKILKKYSDQAGMEQSISPHKLRHFLLTCLKKKGIDDALIQPYSGHASRQSLEVYSKLAITEAQGEYNRVIHEFPV
ncbi:tyrosine-type recombinase/integrase [Melghirimyces algeriensis]|uniref:tyrosine-type recombinase/integrase n=1 Tax=Melghirimyces algeriensis TaxID=910412 RepID=UPI001FE3EAEE|nr:tyrosine-type recombinase/integrase [Melghirimyces algeriensis]